MYDCYLYLSEDHDVNDRYMRFKGDSIKICKNIFAKDELFVEISFIKKEQQSSAYDI